MGDEQTVGDILIFYRTYVRVCLCHNSWPNKKWYRPETWYTHSPRPYLKTAFLFFWKSDLEGHYHRKTAVSCGFSTYILNCHVFLYFHFFVSVIDLKFGTHIRFSRLAFMIGQLSLRFSSPPPPLQMSRLKLCYTLPRSCGTVLNVIYKCKIALRWTGWGEGWWKKLFAS